jgi:AcrR family transcriptional regulator
LSNQTGKSTEPRKRMTAQARREVIEQAATEVFAERGYQGASIDEIARRSGVSPPIVYDHFESKRDLHRRLLERHFAELRGVWRENLLGEDPARERIARAFDAWFAYVQSHPYAWRMLFRDTTGEPEVQAIHDQVAAQSRAAVLPLLIREPGAEHLLEAGAEEALDMVWEVLRGVLQGLALWWYEHQHIPRAQVVATAMNTLWVGFERVMGGELWQPKGNADREAVTDPIDAGAEHGTIRPDPGGSARVA